MRAAPLNCRGAIERLVGQRTQAQRKALQIVFQNPGLALNRSQTVRG